MWADPIEMAAIRGESQREADRRGIALEDLLREQKAENDKRLWPDETEKLSKKYINELQRNSGYESYQEPSGSFWDWLFKIFK